MAFRNLFCLLSIFQWLVSFISFFDQKVLKPNTVNINDKIKSTYIDKFLPLFCEAGDDSNYGSTATSDIAVLQALSKRIHYGKYVAEGKSEKKVGIEIFSEVSKWRS
jgi:chorismate mutase